MCLIAHLVAGFALGSALKVSLWILVPAALGLHVLLDLVPHWDYGFTLRRPWWAYGDFALSAATFVVCYSYLGFTERALLTGLVSAAPDLDILLSVLPVRWRLKWFPSHWASFPHGRAGQALGILTQVGAVAVCMAILVLTHPSS
jgi:hypothetical protein